MFEKKVYLTLDTETCDLAGNVYDIGWIVHDRKGTMLASYNALVKEIFTDADKMMGAFYAKKLFTHYAPMLEAGTIRLISWQAIMGKLVSDIETFGVNVFCAYNIGFDIRAIKQTHKVLGNTGKILPRKIDLLDIWQFACETKLSQSLYKRLAITQGWVSDAGNIRTGAEYAYRFCAGDWGFIEQHTALDDARIETKILADCLATKKRIPYNRVNGSPWRLVNARKTA